MEYNNISLKKFFKKVYKLTLKTLEENPNNLVKVSINLNFGGDTTADVKIEKYEGILIPSQELKK